jgi:arylsulfatase A-like enzyme
LLAASASTSHALVLEPVVRFAEPPALENVVSTCGAAMDAPLPADAGTTRTATIADDVRPVLSIPASRPLLFAPQLEVPKDHLLVFTPPIDEAFSKARHLLIESIYFEGGSWKTLPSQFSRPAQINGIWSARIEFAVPESFASGASVGFAATAYERSCEGWEAHETAEQLVPADSRLDFSIGLFESSRAGESARFLIEACTAADECRVVFDETLGPDHPAYREWADRSVDLGPLAGSKVRFRFRTDPGDSDFRRTIPVWGDPTILRPAAGEREHRNVILISLDTLSAAHLPMYGYELDTAPFLNEMFGQHGTVFERSVASATATSPSHMAMFTSRFPSTTGVTTGLEVLPPQFPTVAEIARAAGMATGAVTENGWLSVQHGFSRGFSSYVENKSPDIMSPTGQVTLTLEKSLRWLKANKGKQFFLFVHTFQVHDPYVPPDAYRELFPSSCSIAGSGIPHAVCAERRAYDQEIRFTDDELKKFFGRLGAEGLMEDTVVVMVSDHGEEFGEHGWLRHGAHFYEPLSQVPMLFAGAGIRAGKRVRAPVSHLDLAPTILDLLGLPPINGAEGLSLAKFISDANDPATFPEDRLIVTESWGHEARNIAYEFVPFDKPAFAVRRGDHKLARYGVGPTFRYEYFDLGADPGEKTNLYPERVGEIRDLMEALDGYEKRARSARDVQKTGEGDGTDAPAELDPRQREKLKALGYLQ